MKTSLRYKTLTKYLRILAICGIILSILPCLMICIFKSATGFIRHPWLLLIAYFVCNVLLYPLSGLLAYRLCKTNTLITVVMTWILYIKLQQNLAVVCFPHGNDFENVKGRKSTIWAQCLVAGSESA